MYYIRCILHSDSPNDRSTPEGVTYEGRFPFLGWVGVVTLHQGHGTAPPQPMSPPARNGFASSARATEETTPMATTREEVVAWLRGNPGEVAWVLDRMRILGPWHMVHSTWERSVWGSDEHSPCALEEHLQDHGARWWEATRPCPGDGFEVNEHGFRGRSWLTLTAGQRALDQEMIARGWVIVPDREP